MSKPILLTCEIEDTYVRKNFILLNRYFQSQVMLQDWVFLQAVVPSAVTNFKIKHGLIAIPKDVIQTSKIGPGTVVFNYELFDDTFVDLTTSGPCTVRFFVGSVAGV